MFSGYYFSHLQEHYIVCYSLWYNASTMLPAGSYRPATTWVHYTIIPQVITHSLVLLKMGEIIARNMLR